MGELCHLHQGVGLEGLVAVFGAVAYGLLVEVFGDAVESGFHLGSGFGGHTGVQAEGAVWVGEGSQIAGGVQALGSLLRV